MGLISEAFLTLASLHREIDGKIWDYTTQSWLPPTSVSEAAADQAITDTMSAALDLVPFPINLDVLGIIQINVDRSKMDTLVGKVQTAMKNYAEATSTTTEVPVY